LFKLQADKEECATQNLIIVTFRTLLLCATIFFMCTCVSITYFSLWVCLCDYHTQLLTTTSSRTPHITWVSTETFQLNFWPTQRSQNTRVSRSTYTTEYDQSKNQQTDDILYTATRSV